MKIDMPVFWIPVSIAIAMTSSIGLFKTLAMVNPKENPNQGNPIPVNNTCQVIISKMYKLAQTPKIKMNKIRNKAKGFKIFTMNFETFGAHLANAKPMDKGTTKKKA